MFNLTMLKTMDSTKRQRLIILYDYARTNKFCKNKKTFAQLIEMNEGNMSNALNNDDSNYLTDSLFYRLNSALGDAFNTEWLLHGTGEMLAGGAEPVRFSIKGTHTHSTPAPAPAPATTTTKIQPSYDDDDVEYLKKRVAELEAWNWSNTKLIKLLEKEIDELKKGAASARAN